MIIALDYDDTYTKDPHLWDEFARYSISRGHIVYCVSARAEHHMDDPKNTIGKIIGPDKCFGTNIQPKKHFMWENHKIRIDVWIDDMPWFIDGDQSMLFGGSMPYQP
jgi:hypothetical protein